ncbi:uncharacterized protein si:dkey-191c17.2 [Anguilla rostrata]|uniref:uncharacterized protein si:dkey-191c17.2 n=1 Tax=Anguilla rostrata TaxID=7938 RepID=UPI0030D4A113
MLLQDVQLETEEDKEGEKEAGPQGALGPIRVSVELQYQLGERTETQLREMGARCVEESTLTDLYYDTESFQLAAQQTWLSRQASQWRLIQGQGPNSSVVTGDEAKHSEPRARVGSGASPVEMYAIRVAVERGGKLAEVPEGLKDDPLPGPVEGSEPLGDQKILLQPPPVPQYCELTASSAIVEHLAHCLQVASTEEEGGETMSVDRFVELAGIQNYGCWTVSRRLEYRLPGTCTLEVRKDYTGFPRAHIALLTMGANVLDIGRELEKMESLAAELDLQHRLA